LSFVSCLFIHRHCKWGAARTYSKIKRLKEGEGRKKRKKEGEEKKTD